MSETVKFIPVPPEWQQNVAKIEVLYHYDQAEPDLKVVMRPDGLVSAVLSWREFARELRHSTRFGSSQCSKESPSHTPGGLINLVCRLSAGHDGPCDFGRRSDLMARSDGRQQQKEQEMCDRAIRQLQADLIKFRWLPLPPPFLVPPARAVNTELADLAKRVAVLEQEQAKHVSRLGSEIHETRRVAFARIDGLRADFENAKSAFAARLSNLASHLGEFKRQMDQVLALLRARL